MLADDISITANGKSIDEIELGLNEDLGKIRLWLQANKLSHNVAKTEYMFIGSRQTLARLSFEPNVWIGRDPHQKSQIYQNNRRLRWWFSNMENKCFKTAQIFCKSRCTVSVYNALIMPHFDYCCKVWNVLGVLAERLQKHHNKCARVIMRYKNEAGKSELVLHHLGWSLLSEQRILTKALRFSKTWHLRSFRIFSGTHAQQQLSFK